MQHFEPIKHFIQMYEYTTWISIFKPIKIMGNIDLVLSGTTVLVIIIFLLHQPISIIRSIFAKKICWGALRFNLTERLVGENCKYSLWIQKPLLVGIPWQGSTSIAGVLDPGWAVTLSPRILQYCTVLMQYYGLHWEKKRCVSIRAGLGTSDNATMKPRYTSSV